MTEKFDIEKRARELFPPEFDCGMPKRSTVALQLAREACAAQAEEILEYLRSERDRDGETESTWHRGRQNGLACAVNDIERRYAAPPPPKSREEFMAASLEAIRCGAQVGDPLLKPHEWSMKREDRMTLIANRALSYTPQGGGGPHA